jgi:hypothetical protein
MIGLFLFLLAAGAVVAWWQLMHGRQKARKAAEIVCANHGLQLLDDTVSLSSVTWSRKAKPASILANYGFEFATNGAIRRQGIVSLGFPYALTVTLDMEEGRLIEEFKR